MRVARMYQPNDEREPAVVTVLTVHEGGLYAGGDLDLVDPDLEVPTDDGFVSFGDDPHRWLTGLPEEYRTPYLMVDLVDVPDDHAGELLAGMTRLR